MALSLKRLGYIALILVAVLLPLRKPGPTDVNPYFDERGMRLQELIYRSDKARTVWSALSQRDSAMRLVSRLERPATVPVVELQGFGKGARDSAAEARITELWRRIGKPHPEIGVAVLLYNRERYATVFGRALYRSYWGNLITERNGVIWCIAIVPGELWRGQPSAGKELLDHAVAPCALLAVYGPPGAGMRRWLEATRYAAARSNAWLDRETGRVEGERDGPWVWLGIGERGPGAEQAYSLVRALGAWEIVNLRAPPYDYGARGVRCVAGDAASCEASVLRAVVGDSTIPADLTLGGFLLFSPQVNIETLRAPGYFYLSELIRAHGRERFAAFWSSELPFDQAFAQAFGVSLGNWTAQWARRQWEASWLAHYYGKNNLILGVNLEAGWLLLLIVWSGLGLLAAGWAAARREVI